MKAGMALVMRRIDTKAKRAEAASKRQKKPTAAELVRRLRIQVQRKLPMQKMI